MEEIWNEIIRMPFDALLASILSGSFLIWSTVNSIVEKRKHKKLKQNEIPPVHFDRNKRKHPVLNTRNKYV